MRSFGSALLITALFSIGGIIRFPFEQRLSTELRQRKIIPPLESKQNRLKLKSTGFLISAGSLRPTLAAFYSLKVSSLHLDQKWEELETLSEKIALTDPHNLFYWKNTAWHLAYNAAAASLNNLEIPPLRRKDLYKEYISKGSSYYDRAIEKHPTQWTLYAEKAKLWSSPFRIEKPEVVEQTLRKGLAKAFLTPKLQQTFRRNLFYSLLKQPLKAQEAYELGYQIFQEGSHQHLPSLLNGLCALQLHPQVTLTQPKLSIIDLYGSKLEAIRNLSNYLQNNQGVLRTQYGVPHLLKSLKNQ